MHPAQLGKKRHMALSSVTSSVVTLAGLFEVDQEQIDKIMTVRHGDPHITSLRQIEQIAKVLENMADQAGQSDPLGRKEAAAKVLTECPGLTKTSRQAITDWATGVSD